MRQIRIIPACVVLMAGVFIFHGCKTAEKIPETRLRAISAGRLLKLVEESAFDYTHFSVRRINIQIDNGGSKTSFRAGMQAVKDQEIQLSVTKFNVPLGRISVTHDSILFVNYLERSYVAGDYKTIANFLNFELDFNTIQAILSGNVFFLFNEDGPRDFITDVSRDMYVIQSEKMRKLNRFDEKGKVQRMERIIRRYDEEALIMHTFYIDPALFVLKRMVLEDKTNARKVDLVFGDYAKVDQKYYPGSIDLRIEAEGEPFRMEVSMSGFSTEKSELTPVKIPDRYQKLY